MQSSISLKCMFVVHVVILGGLCCGEDKKPKFQPPAQGAHCIPNACTGRYV